MCMAAPGDRLSDSLAWLGRPFGHLAVTTAPSGLAFICSVSPAFPAVSGSGVDSTAITRTRPVTESATSSRAHPNQPNTTELNTASYRLSFAV